MDPLLSEDDEIPPIDWQAEAERRGLVGQEQDAFQHEAPGLAGVLPEPTPSPGVVPTGAVDVESNATPGITQSVNPSDTSTYDPNLPHGAPIAPLPPPTVQQPPIAPPADVLPVPHVDLPLVGEVAPLVPPGPEGVDLRSPEERAADEAAGVGPQAHAAALETNLAQQHADERARRLDENARRNAAAQDAARQRQLAHQQELDANAAALDAKWQELYTQKLDPNNWFDSLSTPAKAVVGIASIFGPLRGLYNGSGQDTMADWVGKQIDRDLETQKENLAMKRSVLGQRQNLLGELRVQYGDEDAADFAYVAMKQQQGADALEAWSATYDAPEAKLLAQKQAITLRQQAMANRAAAIEKAQKEAIATYVEAQKIGQKPVYGPDGRIVGMQADPNSLAWYAAHKQPKGEGEKAGTSTSSGMLYLGDEAKGGAVPLPPNLSKADRAAIEQTEKDLRAAEEEQRKGADENSDKAGYKSRTNHLRAARKRHLDTMVSKGVPPELIMRAMGDGPGAPAKPIDPTNRPPIAPQSVGIHGDAPAPLVSPDLRNPDTDAILHPEWAEVK